MFNLFDSHGNLAAVELNGRLYSTVGKHLGMYLNNEGVFVDLDGAYLGEIININRLVVYEKSRHRHSRFRKQNRLPDINKPAEKKKSCPSTLPADYADIDPARLR